MTLPSAHPASETPATRRQFVTCGAALAALATLPWTAGCAGARDPAPNFTYTLLDGTKGDTQGLRGKVLLINFWATSCVTCVAKMPQLVETHRKFAPRGFETLAVAMQYDPPAYVANFAETRRLPFGVVIDNTGAIANAHGPVTLTPTTFLIDKRGRIVKRYVGEPDFAALHALVDDLLAETA